MQSSPFKNVFSRVRYAWMATAVFSAVLLLPLLAVVAMRPSLSIGPDLAEIGFVSVTAVLFTICYVAAPKLQAWLPMGRKRAS